MPRNPLAALVQFLLALPLGVVGLALMAWAAVAYFRIEPGIDALMWAVRNAPFEHAIAPELIANPTIADGAKIAIGVAGLILYQIGAALLRAARRNMQPPAGADAGAPAKAGAQVSRAAAAPAQAAAQSSRAASAPTHAATQPSRAATLARPSAAASAGSTVFARTLLTDDHPSTTPSKTRSADLALHPPAHAPRASHAEASRPHAPPTSHAGLEAQLAGWARLIGKDGKFTPQQRAALARLTPEQIALAKKLPDPAEAIKWAVIGVFALFFVLPFVLSMLGFILAAVFGN